MADENPVTHVVRLGTTVTLASQFPRSKARKAVALCPAKLSRPGWQVPWIRLLRFFGDPCTICPEPAAATRGSCGVNLWA